jgi:site-specific recombinase XerC
MIQYEHCAFEIKQFIAHLKTERRLSSHSLRAYQSDLNQFLAFWKKISDTDNESCSFHYLIKKFPTIRLLENFQALVHLSIF